MYPTVYVGVMIYIKVILKKVLTKTCRTQKYIFESFG
ncbi:hypothetical protein MTCOM_04270 [Moorella thermoacetica]|uniref:Uncharacterized protein n=1 Tax=Neomoorella thermoacetica TaxID=1525 RepID=A0A1J5JW15_NEOTH|nr:hypothetical protein MOOR_26280 [Moorella thermoacetica]OIQ53775.1 hypothetical protein MORE_17530 [Moorella thermoacetica]